MAMWKEEEVGFDLPVLSRIGFTKADVMKALEEVPDDAVMNFVGMFDTFDIVFRWKRLMTPEEEEEARKVRARRLAQIEIDEAEDRRAGF